MSQESTRTKERWTANRLAALVVRILKGDTSVTEAARCHGLIVAEIEDWQERFPCVRKRAARPTEGRGGSQ